MEQSEFDALVSTLTQAKDLPDALTMLKNCENQDIAEVAISLTGQFSLADMQGEQRIYHVFSELDEEGKEQEYAEYVMNLNDDILVFIAWFFYSQFEIKHKETYAAVGKTYSQPKKVNLL